MIFKIRFQLLYLLRQNQPKIHVNQVRAGLTHYVATLMDHRLVHACLISKDYLQTVDLNVQSTKIVRQIKRAST